VAASRPGSTPVAVHVHQDGRIRMTLLLGEIIDPEHGDLPGLRVGQRPHQPDQGETGYGRAQRPGEPGTRAASQRKRAPPSDLVRMRYVAQLPPAPTTGHHE
jgi:hypothetical protein